MIREKLILTLLVFMVGLYLQLSRSVSNKTKPELRVELVQVVFRHGERTPREKEMWPTDLRDLSLYEPWSLAQLTNKGKRTEFRIGQLLRERYDKFLGDVYRPSDVYAYSTDHDRTKMSLQLVLAGLYRPGPTQIWNENLSWMPIPTHYMPEKLDDLMKPDASPLYLEALQKARDSEENIKKVLPYQDLFKFLTEKTGTQINRTNQVYEIYNLLVSQKTLNMALPAWCTDEMYSKLQEVAKLEYEIRSYTPQMKRLNGGTLVKRFIENIKKNEARFRPRKIYLYSGHEVNIAGIAKALNFTEPQLPSFGSAIIFEKLRGVDGNIYIRMLLWTGMTEELITYKFGDSDEICPMDKYVNVTKDIIPSDEECKHKYNYVTKEDLQHMYEDRLSLN